MTQPAKNLELLLRQLQHAFERNAERYTGVLGLTPSECRVLLCIHRNHGVTQSRLAALTTTEPMTLVRLLNRMQHAGLVERQPDTRDNRARRIFVTEGAYAQLVALEELELRTVRQAFQDFSSDERRRLLQALARMHANLATQS